MPFIVEKREQEAVKAFDEAFDELESKGVLVMKDWESILNRLHQEHPYCNVIRTSLTSGIFQSIYHKARGKICASASEENSDTVLKMAKNFSKSERNHASRSISRHIAQTTMWKIRDDEKIYPFNNPIFAKIPFRSKDELDMFEFLYKDAVYFSNQELFDFLKSEEPVHSKFLGRILLMENSDLSIREEFLLKTRLRNLLFNRFFKYGRFLPVEENPYGRENKVAIRRTSLPRLGIFF